MNLREVEAFVVVAEELHFGRAASRLEISTPNLSRRIAEVETELRVRLFERTSRQVRLTPEGALLLPNARRALSELRSLQASAANASDGRAGIVHIAYASGSGPTMAALVQLLRIFEPRIDVLVEYGTTIEVADAVKAGRATIGMCRPVQMTGLSRKMLSKAAVDQVVMAASHRLAGHKEVTFSEIEGEQFLYFDSTIESFADAKARMADTDRHLDIKFERIATEPEGMDRVAAGYGLWLVSQHLVARNPRPDVAVAKVSDYVGDPPDLQFMIWRTDNDTALLSTIVDLADQVAMS